jgi:ATP-dependent DNA helicase RecG
VVDTNATTENKTPKEVGMNSKALEELISKGESQNVEFKQSASSAKDLAKEIATFANTCGGILIIGVDDKGIITGIKDFKETEQTISNALNHNCIPPIQASISRIDISGRILIAVDILAGISKPYEANHVIYLRVGSSARPASREEKQDMYASSIKEGYDMLPIKGAVLDDLSQDEITKYMQRRNARLNTPIESFSEFLLMKLNAVV